MKNKNYYKRYGNTVVYFVWEKHFGIYFKGTAVCRPEDKFDLETGIKLARQKAVTKLHSWMSNVIQDRLDMIEELNKEVPELIKQRDYWRDKAAESFTKLVKTLDELK